MENSHRFFQNTECKYYPCHKGVENLNCLFCYCPFYNRDNCPGNPEYKEKEGRKIKICANCIFPHQAENYDIIIEILKEKINNYCYQIKKV